MIMAPKICVESCPLPTLFENIPGSLCLHDFNVCIMEWGVLETRLPMCIYNSWYLILQFLDSLPERGDGIFVHGGVQVPLGGISAWKELFSFWILVESKHLSTCCMCLGSNEGKEFITYISHYRANSYKLSYPMHRKHTSEFNSFSVLQSYQLGFTLL